MKKLLLVISTILLLAGVLFSADCISNLDESGQQSINWTTYTYNIVGYGTMKTAAEEPNRNKAYASAKAYAEMDAMRQALYATEGTLFTCYRKGEQFTEVKELMEAKAEGRVKVKFIKDEMIKKPTNEGAVYFVKVEAVVNMFDTPAGAIFNKQIDDDYKIIEDIKPANIPQPKVNIEVDEPIVIAPLPSFPIDMPKKGDFPTPKGYTPATPSTSTAYTSVIFQIKGYKLDRCMSPKIRIPNGDVVWCGADFDCNLLSDRGILAYCNTIADAKQHKYCGTNPLIINAINVAGKGKFKTDIIISTEDAALLKAENAKGKFLDEFNVIVVSEKYGQ